MNNPNRTKKSYTSQVPLNSKCNSMRQDGISIPANYDEEESEEAILERINLRKQRKLIDIENREKIQKFIKTTKDGVKHFSVPLTDKYEAYSCFALPNSLNLRARYIAGLLVKVKNKKEDTVDPFLFVLFTFDRENLDENLLLKDGFYLELFNKLLEENLLYLTSEKFTDERIELGIKKFINNEIEGILQ